MSNLSVRQFLKDKGADPYQGVKHLAKALHINSLRLLLCGGYEIRGDIYNEWERLGRGAGKLGYAISNLQVLNPEHSNTKGQKFENGAIIDFGNGVLSSALNDGTVLPETPYVLTLEEIQCTKQTKEEFGADKLWIRLIVTTSPSLNGGELNQIIDYKNDNVHAGDHFYVGRVLYSGTLPEYMELAYMAIEVDLESDAEQVMNTFAEKIKIATTPVFNTGSAVTETILWFNIAMNGIGITACEATGPANPAFWIGGIAGTALEGVLLLARSWYETELIGAFQRSIDGLEIQKVSLGTSPLPPGTGRVPIEVPIVGSSGNLRVLMLVSFNHYPDGDIKEIRRFITADTDTEVDYTFTFRHCVGNRIPEAPRNLSVETNPYYIMDYSHDPPHKHWAGVENIISWIGDGGINRGFEVERLIVNKDSQFIKIASFSAHHLDQQESFTDTRDHLDVNPGDEIKYRIRTYNQNDYSPYSEILSVIVPD